MRGVAVGYCVPAIASQPYSYDTNWNHLKTLKPIDVILYLS